MPDGYRTRGPAPILSRMHPRNDHGAGTRMPALFIPHGAGPCFFMDWDPPHTWDGMAAFLRGIPDSLPARPRALVVISGHWLAPRFSVTGHPAPPLVYDYGGFPPQTYRLAWPAPGDPPLARRIAALLSADGAPAVVDAGRGFDHGVFIPLKLAFPDADIPVVQVSLRHDLDPLAHLQAGRRLAPLRDEGILLVGSGMSFHNMRGYGDPRYTPVSQAFDAWLTAAVEAPPARRERLLAQWAQAPHARECHPPRAEEHLLPLMVVAGAAADDPGRRVYSQVVLDAALSAFRYG